MRVRIASIVSFTQKTKCSIILYIYIYKQQASFRTHRVVTNVMHVSRFEKKNPSVWELT